MKSERDLAGVGDGLIRVGAGGAGVAERVVFLPEIADGDSEKRDKHLAGRRIPSESLDAEFESEIVDSEVDGDDEGIATQLAVESV